MKIEHERESDKIASILSFIYIEYYSDRYESPRIKFSKRELTALSGKAELKAEDMRDIDKALGEYDLTLLRVAASDCWIVTNKYFTINAPSVPYTILEFLSLDQRLYFLEDTSSSCYILMCCRY